jgi:hypothetical protein
MLQIEGYRHRFKLCLFVAHRSHVYARHAYENYCACLNKAILRMLDRTDLSVGSTRNAPWHMGYVLYEL